MPIRFMKTNRPIFSVLLGMLFGGVIGCFIFYNLDSSKGWNPYGWWFAASFLSTIIGGFFGLLIYIIKNNRSLVKHGTEHKKKMTESNNRFVAHFDMLGMKQAVMRNDNEAWRALSGINEARKRIYRITIEIENRGLFIADRVQTFFFSDTVIVFTYSDTIEDLYAILTLSSELLSNSLHRCVPLRGGIAHGDFYFNLEESLFLGKPLISAYEIGENAQWLGIVVDQFIAEMASQHPIGEEIIQWDVPQKDNAVKRQYVINWPWIFRKNFTVNPVTIDAFYGAFEPLYGPYEDLPESAKIKYDNTVSFINSSLNDRK